MNLCFGHCIVDKVVFLLSTIIPNHFVYILGETGIRITTDVNRTVHASRCLPTICSQCKNATNQLFEKRFPIVSWLSGIFARLGVAKCSVIIVNT